VVRISSSDPESILSGDRRDKIVKARSLLCYFAAEALGMKQPEISLKLGVIPAAVSIAIRRGEKIVSDENITPE
jgi:hypothetical protein